jgi:hypothetical protein
MRKRRACVHKESTVGQLAEAPKQIVDSTFAVSNGQTRQTEEVLWARGWFIQRGVIADWRTREIENCFINWRVHSGLHHRVWELIRQRVRSRQCPPDLQGSRGIE